VYRVTDMQAAAQGAVFCNSCGNATEARQVYVTMWTDDGLVVIENVPARVCDNCQEQYYDEASSRKIVKLASSGFPRQHVVREMVVPVISLDDVEA
jgi:YgiT-type zinc finger domain-containing protein